MITGGGARSLAYRQILADFTGCDVFIADPAEADEATAHGAAIQATSIAKNITVRQIRQQRAPRSDHVASPSSKAASYRDRTLKRYMVAADWTGFDGVES